MGLYLLEFGYKQEYTSLNRKVSVAIIVHRIPEEAAGTDSKPSRE